MSDLLPLESLVPVPAWVRELAAESWASSLTVAPVRCADLAHRFALPELPPGLLDGVVVTSAVDGAGCGRTGGLAGLSPQGQLLQALAGFVRLQVLADAVGVCCPGRLARLVRLVPPPSTLVPSPSTLGSVEAYTEWVAAARAHRRRFWSRVHSRAHLLGVDRAAGGLVPDQVRLWRRWVDARLVSAGDDPAGTEGSLTVVVLPLLPMSGSLFDNWVATRPDPSPSVDGLFLARLEVSGLAVSVDNWWAAALPEGFARCAQWLTPSPQHELGLLPSGVSFAELPTVVSAAAALASAGLRGELAQLAWSLERQ